MVGRSSVPGLPEPDERLGEGLRALKGLGPYLWPRDSLELRVARRAGARAAGRRQARQHHDPASLQARGRRADGARTPASIAVPVALIVAYGAARVMSQGFNELRNAVFAKVGQRAVRRVALSAFRHVHALSLRFHLERRTGGLARAVERGTAGIEFLLSFMLFNVVPTVFEIAARLRDPVAALRLDLCRRHAGDDRRSTSASPSAVTDWRIRFRREMNDAQQRSQHQGGRQPAQLRDGQVFRQRGARGASATTARSRPMSAPRSRARRRWRCSMSARARSSPPG